MGQAELRAVFKLINSPENKKVLDDNKQDIQRTVAQLGATANKGLLMSAFGNASASTIAKNPQLFAAVSDAGKKSGEVYSRGFIQAASRFGGGKDLAKIFAMGEFNASGNVIKGLRDVTGKDLAKIMALPDINDIGKYKGATPPIIADVERERLKKMGLGIITAMFNPWIGSRLLSDAVNTGGGGGKGGSIARGIFGAGGAFGFSEFYIAITAIKKAIELVVDGLKWGAQQIKKAIDFAHDLYGKSLENGVGLRFNAQSQMAASVLGVDEKDIFRFAQAAIVMRRLSDAANQIAKAAPDLAYTSAQFKILEYDMLGVASTMADKLSPALNGLAIVLDKLLKVLDNSFIEKILMGAAGGIINAVFGSAAPAIIIALKGAVGVLTALGKSDMAGGGFGQPQTFMKQLPAGAFEKMGLIIGGGMADKALEYQKRTAKAVEGLYQQATKRNKDKASGWYMGRVPFVAGH